MSTNVSGQSYQGFWILISINELAVFSSISDTGYDTVITTLGQQDLRNAVWATADRNIPNNKERPRKCSKIVEFIQRRFLILELTNFSNIHDIGKSGGSTLK